MSGRREAPLPLLARLACCGCVCVASSARLASVWAVCIWCSAGRARVRGSFLLALRCGRVARRRRARGCRRAEHCACGAQLRGCACSPEHVVRTAFALLLWCVLGARRRMRARAAKLMRACASWLAGHASLCCLRRAAACAPPAAEGCCASVALACERAHAWRVSFGRAALLCGSSLSNVRSACIAPHHACIRAAAASVVRPRVCL